MVIHGFAVLIDVAVGDLSAESTSTSALHIEARRISALGPGVTLLTSDAALDAHAKGGGTSTGYRLRLLGLMAFCGAKLPSRVEGELAPLATENVPLSGAELSRFTGDKMSHGLSDVAKRSSGTSKTQVAASLRVVGGRNA